MPKGILFIISAILYLSSSEQLLQLKVSDDKHHLVTEDGKPFFWLGDTGWELFHKLNKADATVYFKKRHEQGFIFTPPLPVASPVPSQREDWILIIDDVSMNYIMPSIKKATDN
jgi:hypothetical protein